MRKVIAKRLTQSFNGEVPHFPLNVDIELDALLAARARINATSPKEGEAAFKLSVNDFIIKASAMALKAVPAANATYTDEAILLHKHADIGVAVAIDGGLITPIVWKAEEKRSEKDQRRDQGHGGPRQVAQTQTGRVSGRDVFGLQSRHVRHQVFRLDRQSTAGRDHVGRRGRRARDRQKR